jgi:hypothetical protein
MDCSRTFVGSTSRAIFQMKSLSLSFKFSFQMSFHKVVDIGDGVAEKLLSKIARYTELVAKRPEHEGIQVKLSVDSVEMRIWDISLEDLVSNTEFSVIKFHCVVPGMIKSEMSSDGIFLLCGNFGDGLNEGIVGIQAIVQIGTFEVVETFKQAPE